MVLPIRIYGDSVLREKATNVTVFDAELENIIANMWDTLQDANGLGLAATQLGIAKRIFIVNIPEGYQDSPAIKAVFINPVISDEKGIQKEEEGCLSVPGIYTPINRPMSLKVKAVNAKGMPFEMEGSGVFARVISHENDHLNGVLFIDHLSHFRKITIANQLKELQEPTQAK